MLRAIHVSGMKERRREEEGKASICNIVIGGRFLNLDWNSPPQKKKNQHEQYVETLQEQLADLEGAAPAKR